SAEDNVAIGSAGGVSKGGAATSSAGGAVSADGNPVAGSAAGIIWGEGDGATGFSGGAGSGEGGGGTPPAGAAAGGRVGRGRGATVTEGEAAVCSGGSEPLPRLFVGAPIMAPNSCLSTVMTIRPMPRHSRMPISTGRFIDRRQRGALDGGVRRDVLSLRVPASPTPLPSSSISRDNWVTRAGLPLERSAIQLISSTEKAWASLLGRSSRRIKPSISSRPSS